MYTAGRGHFLPLIVWYKCCFTISARLPPLTLSSSCSLSSNSFLLISSDFIIINLLRAKISLFSETAK